MGVFSLFTLATLIILLNISTTLFTSLACPECPHFPPPIPTKPPPYTPKPPTISPPYIPKPPPIVTPPPYIPKPPIVPPSPPTSPCPPPPLMPTPPCTSGCPSPTPPSKQPTCPIDTLKLKACVDELGGLVHAAIGSSAKAACCPVLGNLSGLDAAICLCTTIKAKLLNLDVVLPIALQVLIECGKTPPKGFKCPT